MKKKNNPSQQLCVTTHSSTTSTITIVKCMESIVSQCFEINITNYLCLFYFYLSSTNLLLTFY